MALTIEIPDEAVQALGLPAPEVRVELTKELAVEVYARGVLSLGKAVEMAGLHARSSSGVCIGRYCCFECSCRQTAVS